MVVAAEKGRMQCTGEFNVTYTWQADGAALHLFLLLELSSMRSVVESWQQSCRIGKYLSEKKSTETQCVVCHFRITWRMGM